MVNPLDFFPLWRALRQYSLTFAVVFASALLGVSVVRMLRWIVGELSLPWIFLWLVPAFFIGLAAKYEREWLPDETLRRRLAFWLVMGSIVIAIVAAQIRARYGPPEPERDRTEQHEPVRRGPRGK